MNKEQQLKVGDKLVHKEGEVFHLFTERLQESDATIPLRWCVCQEELDKLKTKGAKDLHVLIVVHPEGRRYPQIRYLVPLENLMTYIAFSRPGKHLIQATIVWPEPHGSVKKMKKFFLDKSGQDSYNYNALDFDAVKIRTDDLQYAAVKTCGEETLKIDIAEGFFAKEPAAWVKWWGNLWFKYPPTDQCDFRKRKWFVAFNPFAQPIPTLIYMILAFLVRLSCASYFLLLGFKGISLKPLVRIFRYSTDYIWLYKCGSIFTGIWRSLAPLPLIVVFLVYLTLNLCGVDYWVFKHPLYFAGGLVGGAVMIPVLQLLLKVIGFIFVLFMKILDKLVLPEGISNSLKTRAERRAVQAEERRLQRAAKVKRDEAARIAAQWDEYGDAFCPGQVLEASLKALPRHRRSITLRFYDLKRKVCRPFAK